MVGGGHEGAGQVGVDGAQTEAGIGSGQERVVGLDPHVGAGCEHGGGDDGGLGQGSGGVAAVARRRLRFDRGGGVGNGGAGRVGRRPVVAVTAEDGEGDGGGDEGGGGHDRLVSGRSGRSRCWWWTFVDGEDVDRFVHLTPGRR